MTSRRSCTWPRSSSWLPWRSRLSFSKDGLQVWEQLSRRLPWPALWIRSQPVGKGMSLIGRWIRWTLPHEVVNLSQSPNREEQRLQMINQNSRARWVRWGRYRRRSHRGTCTRRWRKCLRLRSRPYLALAVQRTSTTPWQHCGSLANPVSHSRSSRPSRRSLEHMEGRLRTYRSNHHVWSGSTKVLDERKEAKTTTKTKTKNWNVQALSMLTRSKSGQYLMSRMNDRSRLHQNASRIP